MLKGIFNIFYKGYEQLLIQEVGSGKVPGHVAIIMDGNRRYASRVGKSSYFGHSKGAEIAENVIEWSWELGIKQLTVYAFSSENFKRSAEETNNIFKLISLKFDEMCEDKRTHERKMKIRAIGDRKNLPPHLLKSIEKAERATKDYDNLYLNVAIGYGGRQEIIQAVRGIAAKVRSGELMPEDITESTISDHLYPAGGTAVPNVDLIIRTGGDERMSNFLPWQTNGNECAAYFCAPFWPEFRKIDFLRSIRVYQTRLEEKRKINAYRTTRFLRALGRTEMGGLRCRSNRTINSQKE